MKYELRIIDRLNVYVYEDGHIVNIKTCHNYAHQKTASGYHQTGLVVDGKLRKTFMIHRLVAEAFIPNPDNLPYVNHKDGNKANNHYSNLEWCTHLQNMRHAKNSGLWTKDMGKDKFAARDAVIHKLFKLNVSREVLREAFELSSAALNTILRKIKDA